MCYYESISSKKEKDNYWKYVGQNVQYILGSKDIIDMHNKNIEHAKTHNYKIVDNEIVIKELSLLFKVK